MAHSNVHQAPDSHAMKRTGDKPRPRSGKSGDVIQPSVTAEAKAHRAKTLEERSANKGAPTTTYAT